MADDAVNKQDKSEDRLAQALSTVAEVVLGQQLDAVNDSVKQLDSELNKRLGKEVDQVRKDIARRIDDLACKLDDAVKQQESALDRLDSRASKIVGDVESRVVTVEEGIRRSMRSARKTIDQDFASRDETLKKELDELTQGLAEIQAGLSEQADTSNRVSALLNNMAHVFTGMPATTPPAQPGMPDSDLVVVEGEAAEKSADVEGTVDKLFSNP